MISRFIAHFMAGGALLVAPMSLQAQLIEGPTEPTTCSRDFRPPSLTFHDGYAWDVTFYTFPYQFGHARYSALPSPAISDDGSATWTDPGAYVECTVTWYYNIYGRVETIKFNWHIISYTGTVTANGECGGEGGEWTDPIYITSYDPYLADQAADDLTVQNCDGGGGGGGGEETLTCWWEWMEIEISYDGGKTWHPFWSGLGQVCEQQAA